jgi:formamidopyrimidine-DNA glycosylase
MRQGIDALTDKLTGDILAKLFTKKTSLIKTSLLDQSLVAGIGNIYASEILYWADISPTRPCSSLNLAELEGLALVIQRVLSAATEVGGSTLPDYTGTSGALGHFDRHFAVFQREGSPCPRCNVACVVKVVLSGRSTYYCPVRQK